VVLQNICLALFRASNIYCLCKILYVDVVCFCIPASAFLKNTQKEKYKKNTVVSKQTVVNINLSFAIIQNKTIMIANVIHQ